MLAQRTTMYRIEDMEMRDKFTGEYGALVTWDEKGKKVRFRDKAHRDAFYDEFVRNRTIEIVSTMSGRDLSREA